MPEKIGRRGFLSILGWVFGAAAASYLLGSAIAPKPPPVTVTTTETATATTTVQQISACPKVIAFPEVVSFTKGSENLVQLEFLNFDPSLFPYDTRAYASMNGIVVEYFDKKKELVQVRTWRKNDPQRIIYYFDKEVFVGHVDVGPVYLQVSVPQAGFEDIVKVTIKDKPMQTLAGNNVRVTSGGIPIVFSHVEQAGTTTVRIAQNGPEPPGGVTVVSPFYHVETTAKYSGPILIALPFDDEYFPAGMVPRVIHFNENGGEWEDVTYSIDTEDKLICGRAWSLSTFVVGKSN
jgi:hypothetical protein